MSVTETGCCGAYCKTCPEYNSNCKGCKTGYADGSRDIKKARCRIKVCCINNNFSSCADCEKFETCEIIQQFHNKSSYKYQKYKEAILFIREHGYADFLNIANTWKRQYGKYK